jgi:hypothetical protein
MAVLFKPKFMNLDRLLLHLAALYRASAGFVHGGLHKPAVYAQNLPAQTIKASP